MGERMGEDLRGGDMIEGSEFVARWRLFSEDGPGSVKYVESVRVRCEGRLRPRGTSGSVADGTGLGDGRLTVSREPRRLTCDDTRLFGITMSLAQHSEINTEDLRYSGHRGDGRGGHGSPVYSG